MPVESDDALAAAAEAAVSDALRLQHDLLGLPETPMVLAARERRRRAGRPAGARNKRSDAVASFVLDKLGDPLLHQAAVAVMSVDELVALGFSPAEALAEKRLAAAVVLPYLHSRRPLDVHVSEHKVVRLTIVDMPPDAAPTTRTEILGVVENQQVSDGDDGSV